MRTARSLAGEGVRLEPVAEALGEPRGRTIGVGHGQGLVALAAFDRAREDPERAVPPRKPEGLSPGGEHVRVADRAQAKGHAVRRHRGPEGGRGVGGALAVEAAVRPDLGAVGGDPEGVVRHVDGAARAGGDGGQRAGAHRVGHGRGQHALGVPRVVGEELLPERVDTLSAVPVEEGVGVPAEAGGVVELGDEPGIVVILAPAEERRARAVGIVGGGLRGVDAEGEVLRLEADPADVVGHRLDEPARRAARLDDVGGLVDGKPGVVGMLAAPVGVHLHHPAPRRGDAGDVAAGAVDDVHRVRGDEAFGVQESRRVGPERLHLRLGAAGPVGDVGRAGHVDEAARRPHLGGSHRLPPRRSRSPARRGSAPIHPGPFGCGRRVSGRSGSPGPRRPGRRRPRSRRCRRRTSPGARPPDGRSHPRHPSRSAPNEPPPDGRGGR